VRELAQAPAGGLAALKAPLRASPGCSLDAQLEAESASLARRAAAADTQKLIARFLRRP
jgi:enoyl-CoA hydratase/carnithine racemase